MIFKNDEHAEKWSEAIELAGAIRDNDTVSGYYGASLFLITGIPGLYERVKKYIGKGYIDYDGMLTKEWISTGERIIVALAGNLFNGSFFDDYTPADIINYCDPDAVKLVADALLLRKKTVNINTIFEENIFNH